LSDAAQHFFDEGFITEIIRPIKSGKEAEVYLCRGAPHLTGGAELVAAKLHRPRQHRGFANDARYLEGRYRKETHEVRAMERKSNVGRALSYGAWVWHEWETLNALHAAGVDVPRPIAVAGAGLLMTYLGDEETPAPRLREVRLPPETAADVFEQLLRNVRRMLLANVVHADLSAFNVLWWQGRATIIDLPQAGDARFNNNAFDLLCRDIGNLATYFNRSGLDLDGSRIAEELWTAWQFADLWVDDAW
jgi:RIO kinase 1